MRLTKQGHASVRLAGNGTTLVIDPGVFSEPDAAVGADAVLVTHEHPDHFDLERLRAAADARPGLRVYTHAGIAARLDELAERGVEVHAVAHGDAFEVGGFSVRVHGERHAVIHPDLPELANVGFLVDGAVFHPGDALTVPQARVETLLLPLNAPWLKSGEMIDYARAVAPKRAIAIHDALLGERGLEVYGRHLELAGRDFGDFQRLPPGAELEL
ncbi:MBL fold metallo-hydrolase [Allonocardiopsis opalescens]|uniref:L-ascorbate metabolism protein UlaG (Beta-lactamase superfamily) n=1 Tax=Allonocardiopsis opalescens TaxID=1144618 RepID=A0A2T0Q4E9_9ACTN|nr:MBL fold metallo-hydrolase [Allonocardiopsis opalescens]PRX98581.1 L-ascorbate metabolism protein UlaG (beta-lactamase superfamily) [Allonocardiopsis opalescens]